MKATDRKFAFGAVAQGGFAVGIVAIGGVSIGIVAIGGISVGIVALGGLSFGIIALGGIAFGVKTLGAIGLSLAGAQAALPFVLKGVRARRGGGGAQAQNRTADSSSVKCQL